VVKRRRTVTGRTGVGDAHRAWSLGAVVAIAVRVPGRLGGRVRQTGVVRSWAVSSPRIAARHATYRIPVAL
jgi:hypothetical protein